MAAFDISGSANLVPYYYTSFGRSRRVDSEKQPRIFPAIQRSKILSLKNRKIRFLGQFSESRRHANAKFFAVLERLDLGYYQRQPRNSRIFNTAVVNPSTDGIPCIFSQLRRNFSPPFLQHILSFVHILKVHSNCFPVLCPFSKCLHSTA